MTDSQRWMMMVGALLIIGLVYLLSPVLMPFLVAFILAYFFNPLVDRLVAWHLPRIIAVSIVFLFFLILFLGLIFLIVPVLEQQISILIKNIPTMAHWFMTEVWPWINQHFHMQEFDLSSFEKSLISQLDKGSMVLSKVWVTLSSSGMALVGFFVNLGLILVVTFYLLCDWEKVTRSMVSLIPRKHERKVIALINECGEVLGAFFRGQLLVMIFLGLIYAVGLWIVGLNVGILIGLFAGLLSIVPYLGFIVGLLLAAVASMIQFQDWMSLVWVALVFAVGELAESFLLVPFLVGDRVGLHPVAVIFAVLAGGQLFGFVGVLLAVPVSAVIMVFARQLRGHYVGSSYYSHIK